MKKNLFWLDRKELEVTSWIDQDSDIWHIKGYMRYILGWNDWRWIVGNIPS